jgi:hypothetical protein
METSAGEFGFIMYLIDFKQLQDLQNSKKFEIIENIKKQLPKEFETLNQMYYLEDAGLKTNEILYALLAGNAQKYDEQGHAYVFLTQILCAYLGKKLPNQHWYPCHYEYELYEAFATFFDLNIPLDVPENDDYTFQHLFFSRAKIANFLNDFDFTLVEKISAQNKNNQQESFVQFKTWFETALEEEKDLVLFIEALSQ